LSTLTAEAVNALPAEQAPGAAAALFDLAAATQMLGHVDEAITDYELARTAAARAGRSGDNTALWSDRNLGNLYLAAERYHDADVAYSRACGGFETQRAYASRGLIIGS
jgi:tetratricopeptide (TPR) repeat protein